MIEVLGDDRIRFSTVVSRQPVLVNGPLSPSCSVLPLTFDSCIVRIAPMVFLPGEILVAFSPGKASCDRVSLPNLVCLLGV